MATLNECRRELRAIIAEMRDIEGGVRSNFDGIGEDLCADCIDKVASRYEYVLQRLNGVRTNVFADWVNGES